MSVPTMTTSCRRPVGRENLRVAMRHVLFSLLAVGATASIAHAQPAQTAPTASQTPEQKAFQYAEAGKVAMRDSDFDTAIDMYKKANTALAAPVYLFDIAQANRRKSETLHATDLIKSGEYRDTAREYFQKFLDTHPDSEDMELKARGLLARLNEQWAAEHPKEEAARRAEEDRKREEATRAEQARLDEERRKQEARDAIERAHVGSAVVKTKVEDDRSKARVLEFSGGAAVTLGAVAIGVGVYYGLKARSLSNDLTTSNTFDSSSINQGQQDDKFMGIAYAAGGALIVGGVITYWLGHNIHDRAEHQPTMSVTVAPTDRGGSLLVWGSF